MYCNLKTVDFLHYLSEDLVNYMNYVTNLNRDRNKRIIAQAKKLNSLLLANNITPIFLKGTGNLLAGLYEDIAERMVGDIDFIFSKEDYPKAISILKDSDYSNVLDYKYHFPSQKHYSRLQKVNNIAAIEIHKDLVIEKHTNEFNYNFVKKDCLNIQGFAVLSYANKLNLSIITNQINDNGFCYKTIALRNAYDVYLLSKKTCATEAIQKLDKLTNPLNCFLAACYEVFNNIKSLDYKKTKKTKRYLNAFNKQFLSIKASKRRHSLIKIYLFLKSRLNILYKATVQNDYRIWLFNVIMDKSWYNRKLFQLGIKKSQENKNTDYN